MATTITSKEMTLRNLATDITSEIRHQIENQEIMSIPQSNFRDENYMGTAGVEYITDIDERISNINIDGKKSKSGLLSSLTFGLWKEQARDNELRTKGVLDKLSLRIGQSPVLNPPWQFNELDDVRSNLTYPHMGRVYLTYIYQNFPILVFKPGREKLNANIISFFTKGLGSDSKILNNYIRNGGDNNIINGVRMAFTTIKNTTLGAIEGALGLMGIKFADASKYITFKPAMKLYRKMANNLMREFAANMGLLDLTSERADVPNNITEAYDVTKTNYSADGSDENYKQYIKEMNLTSTEEAQMFGDGAAANLSGEEDRNDSISGFDTVTSKVSSWISRAKEELTSTYRGSIPRLDVFDMIPVTSSQKNGIGSLFANIEDLQYLPYMCQSNVSINETFSNSTKEHPIISEINSISQSSSDDKHFGAASKIIESAKNVVNGGSKSLEDIVNGFVTEGAKKVAGEIGSNAGEMGAIMNGNGRMAVPEIWASSSYSRSYSVDFKFWSPTGDTISIFENVYIPYLLLLVLSMPLQTGYNSYVSPFVIKVFSKGLFSIDMGMIESLSVTRGDGANDRSAYNYPRSIKVNVSIKDLSPIMLLSLGNGAFWKYRRANSCLTEYINTMTNISLSDRYDMAKQFNKFWALMTAGIRDKFSLTNIGYTMGSSFLMRPFTAWNRNKVTIDQVETKNIYY